MKITLEICDEVKVIIESNDETAAEVLRTFTNCMLGAGFLPKSVNEAILNIAEEIETSEDKD